MIVKQDGGEMVIFKNLKYFTSLIVITKINAYEAVINCWNVTSWRTLDLENMASWKIELN